jgi:hypothetical protein
MNIENKYLWKKDNIWCCNGWGWAELKPTGRWKLMYYAKDQEKLSPYYVLYID